MSRLTERPPAPLVAITITLRRDVLAALDGMARDMRVDRQEALLRGLSLLGQAGMILTTPPDIGIEPVRCPASHPSMAMTER